MMIKREWRQLLEMIKFSLGKGKAPELRVETDWGKFYRICNRIRSMCGLTECGCFYPLEQLSVNNHIYSLNIHKFSGILEILLQTCYNNPILPVGGNNSNRKSGEEHGRQKKGPVI